MCHLFLGKAPTGPNRGCGKLPFPAPSSTHNTRAAGSWGWGHQQLLFHQAVPNTLNNYLTSELIAQQ